MRPPRASRHCFSWPLPQGGSYVRYGQHQERALPATNEIAQYNGEFFDRIADGSSRSADEVVRLICELFAPKSVVDLGGGAGHWAAAFLRRGVQDVLSVDGPWVPEAARVMSADHYMEWDLSRPLKLCRAFDLALCLETAEHLPSFSAPTLVETLTDAAPVVIFSAALPGQGGDGHINEQLPSYWAALFASRDFLCYSDLRARIWNLEAVEVWYRQNLLCFVRQRELDRWSNLLKEPRSPGSPLLDIAHPSIVLWHKLGAERLESYASRLECDVRQARSELQKTRSALAEIEESLLWRAWVKLRRCLSEARALNSRILEKIAPRQ